jgi:hypothetical protein
MRTLTLGVACLIFGADSPAAAEPATKSLRLRDALSLFGWLTPAILGLLSSGTSFAAEKSPATATLQNYYVPSRGYRIEAQPDPPRYVRNLGKTGLEAFRGLDWLDAGMDFRTRFEYRENDYRPWTDTSSGKPVNKFRSDPDSLWLLRTRAYLGIHDILDPLRFAVEFQDSRSYNGLYERSELDVNEFELIQGYAELFFKNPFGLDRPLSVRAGRMHLELLDRRLVANNEFRNTTNNFEGFRLHLGKKENDWDIDAFAFQPVERLKYNFDRPDEDTWFYGGVLSLRTWSQWITAQPYFLGRAVNGDPKNRVTNNRKSDASIYSPGLRVYGVLGKTGFDYEADINKQFGRTGSLSGTKQTLQQHDALAYALELGYTFDHDWKPRLSGFFGYGTGDKGSKDKINQRFDSFYGFNQPWSRNDYFSWDNVLAPKARLEFIPYKDVRIDTGYHAYWLESSAGGWRRAGLGNGKGETFLGHEFDIRLRHKLNSRVDWSLSYARFIPGEYTTSLAKSAKGPYTTEPSNFFYFEVSVSALE